MKKQNKSDIEQALSRLESYCRERDFAGYSKFDALNSPYLEALFGKSALGRLLVTQAVNRIPLPLRQLLGVRKSRNPKGIANFLKGYCIAHRLNPSPQTEAQIQSLAGWLLQNHSAARGDYRGPGMAWGYNFPWQSPGFFAPRFYPNCIVTVFAAEALLNSYSALRDERFLNASREAARFILEALPVLESDEDYLCIGYVTAPLKWRVININAVAAGFLSKLGAATGESSYLQNAQRMVRWVARARNENYSWNYTDPKSQSGIGPDNYHTGGILDGIGDYMLASGDVQFLDVYRKGLSYYADQFFTDEYAPKWRANREFPQDIHGAAQGILTFAKASAFEMMELTRAERIIDWTFANLMGPDGNFYYQRWRYFTWKLELMRWSNSWMFWSLQEYRLSKQLLRNQSRNGHKNDSTIPATLPVARHSQSSF